MLKRAAIAIVLLFAVAFTVHEIPAVMRELKIMRM
jgi:hypothetical protein